jgi:hypothetical protein
MYNHAYSGPTLTNVTFSGNQADIRGGAMNNYYESNPTLINCILWGNAAPNGPQIRNGNDSTPVISYSDVQGSGGSGPAWDSTLGTDGGHNIDADPRFVDPVAASAAPTTTGDYHLTLRSPTIDAGNNAPVTVATDLDGNPRIADGDRDGDAVVDMGAYELQRRPVGGVTLARASSGSLRLKLGLAALVGLLLAGAGVVRRRRR